MNIHEAKDFFMEYNGLEFHMYLMSYHIKLSMYTEESLAS